jgi:hypothetical protein
MTESWTTLDAGKKDSPPGQSFYADPGGKVLRARSSAAAALRLQPHFLLQEVMVAFQLLPFIFSHLPMLKISGRSASFLKYN